MARETAGGCSGAVDPGSPVVIGVGAWRTRLGMAGDAEPPVVVRTVKGE